MSLQCTCIVRPGNGLWACRTEHCHSLLIYEDKNKSIPPGTSCTDDVRVKVLSFSHFFYKTKYSTETLSICISACLKMLLTAVI